MSAHSGSPWESRTPAALKGLIYADFRKSFSRGCDALIAALQREGDNLILSEWEKLDELIKEVFDATGSSSVVGGYESLDYDFVEIKGVKDDSDFEASIVLDTVNDYGGRQEPLNIRWWQEYLDVHERYGQKYHLAVTERPISFEINQANTRSGRVWVREGQ